MVLMMWKSGSLDMHLLKYGFIGAGLGMGYIAEGLRFKWCARRFPLLEKPPVVQGAPPISSQPVVLEVDDRDLLLESEPSRESRAKSASTRTE
jgi:hypothetical protein